MSGSSHDRMPQRLPSAQRIREKLIEVSLRCCSLLSIIITFAIVYILIHGSVEFFMDREFDQAVIPEAIEQWNEEYQAAQKAVDQWRKTGNRDAGAKVIRVSIERWNRTGHNISPESPNLQDVEKALTADRRIHESIEEYLPSRTSEKQKQKQKQYYPAIEDYPLIENAIDQGIISLPRKRVSMWDFLTTTEWTAGLGKYASYGILPLVVGTLMVAVIAALIALPVGLTTAIYLSEYANPAIRRLAKPTLELLAGIPTVVYGFFAITTVTPILAMFVPGLETPYNQLSGGIVVGIMIIPMVASLSEDALRSVPRSLRDASYALGATQFETSVKVVVPAGLSGVVAAFILAISRAVGETMAVTLACGGRDALSLDPREGVATMTSFIVRIATGDVVHGTTDYYSLFAVGLVLLAMTLSMNIFAQWIKGRFRMVYQ